MRKTFTKTVSEILKNDLSTSLFLGDIGVYGFKSILESYPTRAFNLGILEQCMVGTAAGFATNKITPFISTIAPFLVNRAYEQIKIDLSYQNLNCNIITVGASFDYTALGSTHHCPEDVVLISLLPNFNIFIPGTAFEVELQIKDEYKRGLNYFRLSEQNHSFEINLNGTQLFRNRDSSIAILFIGPLLNLFTEEKFSKADIWYSNNLSSINLINFNIYDKLIIVADFYLDTVVSNLISINKSLKISTLSPKKEFYIKYGAYNDALRHFDINVDKIERLTNE